MINFRVTPGLYNILILFYKTGFAVSWKVYLLFKVLLTMICFNKIITQGLKFLGYQLNNNDVKT